MRRQNRGRPGQGLGPLRSRPNPSSFSNVSVLQLGRGGVSSVCRVWAGVPAERLTSEDGPGRPWDSFQQGASFYCDSTVRIMRGSVLSSEKGVMDMEEEKSCANPAALGWN